MTTQARPRHRVGTPSPGRGPQRTLKVVHVVATLTAGGAERQLEMLTARTRHDAFVAVLYGSGGIAEGMRATGRPVYELRATGWRKLFTPLVLARTIRAERPDVVHVHLLSAQLMGIPAARLARVPLLVSTEHSLMEHTIEGRRLTWWLRLLYRVLERLTTHTIAVSELTAQRLRRLGVRPERVSVADLGIDFDGLAFNPAGRDEVRAELSLSPDTYVIGAVGRLEPVKRMDMVLDACAPLLHEGAVLVVAGGGPLLGELQAHAVRLGVADQLRWLGSRTRMGPVLSAMDVMVSASADESFGMAVVEATGNGLPVVHVTCPALEVLDEELEQVDHVASTGRAADDTTQIREALTRRRRASGQHRWAAPAAVVGLYGAQAAADRVDDVYDRLLSRPDG